MQADSEKLRQAWIKAVQNSIATAFRDKAEDDEVVQLLSHPASSCHARNALLTVRCVCQKMDRKSSTSTGSLDSTGEVKERSLKGESALQRVMAIGGNSICCDCGQPEPSWASINLGITLCIQCSGIHRCVCVCVCVGVFCGLLTILGVLFVRSLGVHFSKVRSLTLDTWEPELLKVSLDEHTDGG